MKAKGEEGSGTSVIADHTPETLEMTWAGGTLVLPGEKGSAPTACSPAEPPAGCGRHPAVVFMHGSSGMQEAFREFGLWLAGELGTAFVAPHSYSVPRRFRYRIPASRREYETVHALRSAELVHAVEMTAAAPWFDGRLVIAGSSEGGLCASRYSGRNAPVKERGRMIFSWTCEDNFFVDGAKACLPQGLPVLNVMSLSDKYFSPSAPLMDTPGSLGHAGRALAGNPDAAIVLIPQAPHTLLNLPQARAAAEAFLKKFLLS